MRLDVDHSGLLWLLLFAILPLLTHGQRPNSYPWLAIIPKDRLSIGIDILLRSLAVTGIVALVLGIAGLHRKRVDVDRVGQGAHIVLLLDRSVSMDQTFANRAPAGREESKTAASVRLVKAFFSERPHDQFAVVAFSTSPILAMPMTAKRSPIMAALDAMKQYIFTIFISAPRVIPDFSRRMPSPTKMHPQRSTGSLKAWVSHTVGSKRKIQGQSRQRSIRSIGSRGAPRGIWSRSRGVTIQVTPMPWPGLHSC